MLRLLSSSAHMCCDVDSLQNLAGLGHDQIHLTLFQHTAFPLIDVILKDGVVILSSNAIKVFNLTLPFLVPFLPHLLPPATCLIPDPTFMMKILPGVINMLDSSVAWYGFFVLFCF